MRSPAWTPVQATRAPTAPSLDPQPVEQALVAAPALAHADAQVEVDLPARHLLHLPARGASDRLDHPPAGADQDALLGLGLGPEAGVDDQRAVVALLELVDLHLHRVRHLVARALERLLADQLGEPDRLGQVALLLRRVQQRPL